MPWRVYVALCCAACGGASSADSDAAPPAPPDAGLDAGLVCGPTALTLDEAPAASPVNRAPDTLALADLDRDGDLDAVTASANGVGVILNDGAGHFGEARLTGGVAPVAVADLDGDGAPEIIANAGYQLGVWTNDGAGGFSLTQPIWIGGFSPDVVLAADLDADGDSDVVLSGLEAQAYENDGTGQLTLAWHSGYELDGVGGALADVDGDGGLDFMNADGSGLSVFLGSGLTFLPGSWFDTDVNDVRALDADDDGDADLLAVRRASTVTGSRLDLLENRLDGTLTSGWTLDSAGRVAAGDFDGDGRTELAASAPGGLWIWPPGGAPAWLPIHRDAADVAAGDLDGDGDVDLAVLDTWTNDMVVVLNPGGGFPAAAAPLPVADTPQALAAFDVDGDGDRDIVAGRILLRQEGGWNEEELAIPCYDVTGIAVGDFTADGAPDMVTACGGEGLFVFVLNDGAGGFTAGAGFSAGGSRAEDVVAADLDGDGDLDLAASSDPAGVFVVYNQGGGESLIEPPLAAGDAPGGLVAADVDGDGDRDLIVADKTGGQVRNLVNQGTGTFVLGPGWAAGNHPAALAAGDLNGDEIVDVVVANDEFIPSSDDVAVLLDDGTGRFAAPRFLPAGERPSAVLVRDLDGVCGPDVIVANQTGSVSILTTGTD